MQRKKISKHEIALKNHGFPDERHIILPAPVVKQAANMPIVRDLIPSRIGYFPYAEGHFVQRTHPIDEWILIYCIEGRGWCSFNNKRWYLRQDTAIVVPAGMPHSYGTTKKEPWSIYWIHMTGKKMNDYLDALNVSSENPLLHLKHEGELIHHFEELYNLLQYGYNETALMALSTSLAHFLGQTNLHKTVPGQQGSETVDNVRKTIAFMNRNLSRNLTLEELANYARSSVPHYVSVFKKQTGMPPVRFYLNLKMMKAAELLSNSDIKIKDVAAQLGMNDPYYFSRLFKKVMGSAPTQYGLEQRAAK